ncbi:MAG: DEAD/DEAH box helicase family protein, partial [Chloroflexota bacterium]
MARVQQLPGVTLAAPMPDDDDSGALAPEGLLDALGGEPVDDATPALDADLLEQYALPCTPHVSLLARPYQREAIRRWLQHDGRGVVVLPTGAGKTVVAFHALAEAPVRTLVIVPTIELLRQWRRGLIEQAGLPEDQVGMVGGGERTVRPVTVMTYDSAAMPRRRLDEFGLLIVDEV